MKPSELIRVLENEADAPSQYDERGRALLSLVAHVYYADERLDEGELAQMQRLTGREDVTAYLEGLRAQPLDLPAIARLFPDAADRDDIITLLEHAQWGDGDPDLRELDLIEKVYVALGVTRS